MNGSEGSESPQTLQRHDSDKFRPVVLIVDDEETILFALEDYLTSTGWRVLTADSAARAEALLASGPFAAAIVDLRLTEDEGDESGLEVVRRIRQRWPGTRVVLLTAYGRGIESEAARLGVSSLLPKPQALQQLEAQLRDLVGIEN